MFRRWAWLPTWLAGNETHMDVPGDVPGDAPPPVGEPLPRGMHTFFLDDTHAATVLGEVTSDATRVWDPQLHMDAQLARYHAITAVLAAKQLPPELVRIVLQMACEGRRMHVVRADTVHYTNDANARHLQTLPLPSKLMHHFLLQVRVEISSHDQGWSSDPNREWVGTYQGSYTWWELTLDRHVIEEGGDAAQDDGSAPSSSPALGDVVEVERALLAYNIHGSREFKTHTVTLNASHPILQKAEPGDTLSVWARSQFGGWVNTVQYVDVGVCLDWNA